MGGRFAKCRKTVSAIAALGTLAALVGCSQPSSASPSADARIRALEQKLDMLEKRTASIETDRDFEKTLNNLKSVAYLTPGSDGYSVIESDLGSFTVNIANIEQYANGSRVTLTFGNLTSATITSPKVKIEWGTVDDKGSPNNEAARSRELEFTQSFQPGAWNNIPVVLEGTPPAQLGFVRVRELTH